MIQWGRSLQGLFASITGGRQATTATQLQEDLAFLSLDVGEANSFDLTVEQQFVEDKVSVGAAGSEYFELVDFLEDVSFPGNAVIIALAVQSVSGSPQGSSFLWGQRNGALTAVTLQRFILWNKSSGGQWGPLNGADQTYPIVVPRAVQETVNPPNPPRLVVGLDPSIIADSMRFSAIVRSAPDGVKVWLS